MIIRRFLEWAETATAGGKAEAASALARSYLYSDLDPAQRVEAEAALTLLLDDPSPLVRRALAEALAGAAEAPAHLILSLALDQSEIAALVLARSPVLRDADLIDAVAVGDEAAHLAVACRPELSAAVCGALAEIADAEALIALLRNRSACLPDFVWRRMAERHGAHAPLREAMLARRDLPAPVRHMLVCAVSTALADFVRDCAWMRPERGQRVIAEAREAAAVTIAEDSGDCAAFSRHLCATGQMTAGLLLRALLSGRMALLEAALTQLAEQPRGRVAAILADRRGLGFAALYRRAGLPDGLFPAFQAALSAWRETMLDGRDADRPAALSRRMIERTLTAIEDHGVDNSRLMALLRRFEAEAAREEARQFVADLVAPMEELEMEIRRLVEEQSQLAA